MDNIYLCFLDLGEFEGGKALRGGCLITDMETNPLEFRCTAPVRPTDMQKVLYGAKMKSFICKELFGLPLIKQIVLKPNLLVVREEVFLDVRPDIDIPMLWVAAADSRVQARAHENYHKEYGLAIQLLEKLGPKEKIFEPFDRVQNALKVAHSQHIGEK